MAYCSSTQRLAGFDEMEAEVQSEEVTDDEARFEVRLVRPCAGCSNEQATYDMELFVSLDHECPEGGLFGQAENERTFELVSTDVEPTDEYQTKDRHGKPIKRARYQRHLLGAHVTANVLCNRCGEEFEVNVEDRVGASEFDDAGGH